MQVAYLFKSKAYVFNTLSLINQEKIMWFNEDFQFG